MSNEIGATGSDILGRMATAATDVLVMSPRQAAARLGLTVPGLVVLLRKHKAVFTQLAPGGQPGDRGRNRWGLTEHQLRKLVAASQAQVPDLEPPQPTGFSAVSPDGRLRARRGPGRAALKG